MANHHSHKSSSHAAHPAKPMPVRVRMFRQGLGDCFLLTFDPGHTERHVLIDCGTLGATSTGVDLATVANVIKTTSGGHLDLVVATHEHWDHISGFASQHDAFAKMKVDHVWLAWTENPDDATAQELEVYKGNLALALQEAHLALSAGANAGNDACLAAQSVVADVADFAGPDALGVGTKEGLSVSLHEAMQFIRTGLGTEAEYQDPSMPPVECDWLPGFRFYVLGPPRDKTALADLGAHGSPELYGISSGLRVGALMHAGAAGELTADAIEGEMPFGSRFRWSTESKESQEWYPKYFDDEHAWRRIDTDWLNSAAEAGEELSLQLDNLTNNTSLVLAIERIADGKVMLFPGDAQEGNWLSWHDQNWKVHDASGAPVDVSAESLLRRTVFYKVGHHGSHNATAKEHGLELMARDTVVAPELTAFIGVDRKVALNRSPKDKWQMPAYPLYRALLERCDGRVVRSDLGFAVPPEAAPHPEVESAFTGLATQAEWTAWAKNQKAAKNIQIADKYIDYTLA